MLGDIYELFQQVQFLFFVALLKLLDFFLLNGWPLDILFLC